MFELVLFIALAGTAAGGLWDLKTTEIPDELPALLITLAIFYWFINAASTGNFLPLIASLAIGTFVTAIGWLAYHYGQWGGADALMLGAIFYLIPLHPTISLFPMAYVFNMFVVSFVYLLLYTIIIGIRNREVISLFRNDLKHSWKMIVGIPVLFAAVYTIPILIYDMIFIFPWELIILIFLLCLFWRYGKVIEEKHFTRDISVDNLKEGDVIFESKKWIGLTKKEVEKLKQTHETVKIKEGVRFAPVFFLTLLATLLFGNILLNLLLNFA
ncbi:MAG: prepilin peptidase [Candidatus Aenigmatarchaeota archaeon]